MFGIWNAAAMVNAWCADYRWLLWLTKDWHGMEGMESQGLYRSAHVHTHESWIKAINRQRELRSGSVFVFFLVSGLCSLRCLPIHPWLTNCLPSIGHWQKAILTAALIDLIVLTPEGGRPSTVSLSHPNNCPVPQRWTRLPLTALPPQGPHAAPQRHPSHRPS